MAASRNEAVMEDVLMFCKHAIKLELQRCIGNNSKKGINILRRTKHLEKGDFLGIVQSWKCNKSKAGDTATVIKKNNDHEMNSTDQSNDLTILDAEMEKKLVQSLDFENLVPFKASVCDITQENDIMLKLDRPAVCQSVIAAVTGFGDQYGRLPPKWISECQPQVCVNVADLMDNADWPGFSINHLRSMLLSEHVARLLQAVGYNMEFMQYQIQSCWREVLKEFNIVTDQYTAGAVQNGSLEKAKLEIHRHLRNCRHCTESEKILRPHRDTDSGPESSREEFQSSEEDKARDGEEPTVIDLQSFLRDHNLTGGYDKNVKLADFSVGSDRLQDLTYLECQMELQKKRYQAVIHVAPQEKSFYQQTLDLGWQILKAETGKTEVALNQIHLIHGPVISRGGQLPVFRAVDLLGLRKKHMRSASVLKYGDIVQGPGWDSTIHALTVAGIKFEMLSTTCRQPVKLDMRSDPCEDDGSTVDSRGGVFVMYNSARLSTLFSNYDKAVQEGLYPSLPPVETLDFRHLREEEEWALVFNYLMPYPSLVRECVPDITSCGPRQPLHTHKVAQFLQDLSRDLSSYYSRVHVLGEARSHLYPVMFCRLHLLKAIQQVMHNALRLLSIEPLSQL